jgi:CubicO group peptidase (beta-lactamase class C family)
MKTIILTLSSVCLSILLYGQRPPIANLPAISWEEAGFNVDSINELIPIMDDFPQKDFRGMVVIKDHQVVMEWYYNSTQRKTINDIRSAGKGITSILLGVAIQEGLVENVEQDVYSFFSKDKYPSLHEDYKKVKIKHLLDMASGLDADTDDWDTPGNAGMWIGKDDWVDYILSVPLANQPGEKWVYADINAVLIGAIIEETSGMSLKDFAVEKVFIPLGITEYYWYTNASNQTGAAGNLYISTLDFAKLGVLVANNGQWADKQIADAAYIERLVRHKVFDLTDYWGLANASYGMLWYKILLPVNGKEYDYLFASGLGGNHLVVVPEEKLVIALTSTAYGQRYQHRRSFQILKKLLGALE